MPATDISYDGLLSIASEEAMVLEAYNDRGTPADGFGHRNPSLKPRDKTTPDKAWANLRADAEIAVKDVFRFVKVPLNQNELDALASAAFNYGGQGWKDQGVIDLINAGKHAEAVALWHSLVKNAGRRDREADLFDKGEYPVARHIIKVSSTGNLGGGFFTWRTTTPPDPAALGFMAPSPAPLPFVAPPVAGFAAKWLASVLRAAGLRVVENSGWLTRGHGDMTTIKGILCHHTAGPRSGNSPSLDVVTNGRPGLSGPLANLHLARDGTFTTVAAGRCYHAGEGSWQHITEGNSQLIGIEAENTGLSNDQPWPAVQMDAYARGCAAILKYLHAAPIMCGGHKEYAPERKIDPTFDMPTFRARIATIMGGTSTAPTPIPPSTPAGKTYTVIKGDTLFSIARRYKTTSAILGRINGLTTTMIRPGQILKVPG